MTNITDFTPLNLMTFDNGGFIQIDSHRLPITKMSATSDYCNNSNGTISSIRNYTVDVSYNRTTTYLTDKSVLCN